MCRAALALGVLAALFVHGCAPAETPEDRIAALVEEAARAFEDGEVGPIIDATTDDFADDRGRDRRALEGLLRLYFRQSGERHVLTSIESIRFEEPGVASLDVKAAIARAELSSLEGLTRADAHLLRFEIELVDEGGGTWKARSATWRELAGL